MVKVRHRAEPAYRVAGRALPQSWENAHDANSSKGLLLQPDDGRLHPRCNEMRVKIPMQATKRTYEICEERCLPGFASRRHIHSKDFETLYMIDARTRWEVGGQTIEVTKGMTVHSPHNGPHEVVTRDGCNMLVVFGPGEQSSMFSKIEKSTPEQLKDERHVHPILARHNLAPLEQISRSLRISNSP